MNTFSLSGFKKADDKVAYLYEATKVLRLSQYPVYKALVGTLEDADAREALTVLASERVKMLNQLAAASMSSELAKLRPTADEAAETDLQHFVMAEQVLIPLGTSLAQNGVRIRYGRGGVAELSRASATARRALEFGNAVLTATRRGAASKNGNELPDFEFVGTLAQIFEQARNKHAVTGKPKKACDQLRKLENAKFIVKQWTPAPDSTPAIAPDSTPATVGLAVETAIAC